MQPISWNIHIVYGLCGIQGRQLHSQLLGVICLNSFSATALVEFFKTFVLEGLNHLASVAHCATLSSRITPRISGASFAGVRLHAIVRCQFESMHTRTITLQLSLI